MNWWFSNVVFYVNFISRSAVRVFTVMVEKLGEIDYKIIYASLLIIMILAAALHLSSDETQSLVVLAFIVVIALGNIGYLFSKRKKPEKK